VIDSRDLEPRASLIALGDSDIPGMGFNDPFDNREPVARTVLVCRVSRLERGLALGWWNSGTVVLDKDALVE